MASFSSSPNLPISEYVDTVDPGVYASIGMQKQQLYNAGVEKINASLSTIAGIQVIKDAHKQYLNSTVNAIQTDINKLAGEDFSKQNVVNQALGLASKVARDPIIQNAVISTQRYNQATAAMQSAIDKGESSIENEWDFQQKAQSWLKDTDASSPFSATYTPYRDVRKKALEVLKSIKPTANVNENAFIQDASGKLIVNDAILREEFKGINPQQIKSAIESSLDQGDINQLSITGRYNFSNYTPQLLQAEILTSTNTMSQEIDSKIKALQDKKSTLTDGAALSEIDQKINALSTEKEDMVNRSTSYLNTLKKKGGKDIVASQIYAEQFINEFSNAFSYTETSKEFKSNPFMDVQLRREAQAFQTKKWEQEKALKEQELKSKGLGNLSSLPMSISQEGIPQVTMVTAKDKAVDLQKQADSTKAELFKFRGTGADEAWYEEQVKLYEQGAYIDPIIKEYIKDIKDAELQSLSISQGISKIEQEAAQRFKLTDLKLPSTAKPIRLSYSGQIYDYTPEELATYAHKKNILDEGKFMEPLSQLYAFGKGLITGKTENTQFEKEYIQQEFTPKERILFDAEQRASSLPRRGSIFAGDNRRVSSEMDFNILKEIEKYKRVAGSDTKVLKEREDWKTEQIKQSFNIQQPKSFALPTGKKEFREQLQSNVGQLLIRASQMDESFGGDTDFDAVEKLNADEATTYSLIVNPANELTKTSYSLALQGKGEDVQYIPLTPEDKVSLFGAEYEPPTQAFNRIQGRLSLTGNNTTNFDGVFDPVKASVNPFLKKQDFPSVSDFSITGDIVSKGGKYSLSLNIYDPLQKTIVKRTYAPSNGLMDEAGLLAAISGLSNESIYQLLYGKQPSADELQQIKEINKNPE